MPREAMTEELINIEVNGVPMKARKGDTIIRVTDANDVYIPRFCYHNKLSVPANCRMCLVEVEKAPKPLPACATPVAEGMKIFTHSKRATDAQRATMEFLLINHPLDCPICDQGGECELQDLAVGFGQDISRFQERKRVVKDENLGPLVSTDMTRCIQCSRCVRFTDEIAGIQELGLVGRGEHEAVRSFLERTVDHELSGNIIDLCPVGALNSKPFRYRARAWEMTEHELISPHDGVGSNLFGHVLRGRLMRVVPRQNEAINETWIADRDRFGYEGVYSADRLESPMIRREGGWQSVDWPTALAHTAQRLQAMRGKLGVLASSSSTLEELYLASRLCRALGSHNIDHRLRQRDFRDQQSDPLCPSLGVPIAAVDDLQGLLVIGSNLRREAPILAHRVRTAARRGARVAFLNPARFTYHFPVAAYCQSGSAQQLADLAAVLAAAAASAGRSVPESLAQAVRGAQVGAAHRELAAVLGSGERKAIWLGALALRHPAYADLRALAQGLAEITGSTLGVLAEGANAAGAYLAGAVPHREAGGKPVPTPGWDAGRMLREGLPACILLGGVEPWAEPGWGAEALKTLSATELLIGMTPFASEPLKQCAHVLLPVGTFAEVSGTFVNLDGLWQSFSAAAQPLGETRPGWKVLRALGTELAVPGFEYATSEEVREELRRGCADSQPRRLQTAHRVERLASESASVTDLPMYQVDAIVRRAVSLQRTAEGRTQPVTY